MEIFFFIARIVLVPVIFVLMCGVYGLLRVIYWIGTRDRVRLVYLAVPPYRYSRWCDAWARLCSPNSSNSPATAMLDDILRTEAVSWFAAIRKRHFTVPPSGSPIVPESQDHNFLLHSLLKRGARYMTFERERLEVHACVPMRVTSREDWRERGTISVGEIFGIRCELREPSPSADTYAPTVSVGDRVLVRITEARGRAAVAELADPSTQKASLDERIGIKRESFLVVASPWIYLELALARVGHEAVCQIQDIQTPSCQELPENVQKLHRLVVRNGRKLSPAGLILLGTTPKLMARVGPIAPEYPRLPEFCRPQKLTVAAATAAFYQTIVRFLANRRDSHRLWKDIFVKSSVAGPSTLFRRAILFEPDGEDRHEFWARRVDDTLLHFAANGVNAAEPNDFVIKPQPFQNAKAETYHWLRCFSQWEPRRVRNWTKAWWVGKGARA